MPTTSSSSPLTSTPLFSLLVLHLMTTSLSLTAATYQLTAVRGSGRKVGGWTDIPDAPSNKEILALGRFSVDEYNRKLQETEKPPINFSGVLSGRRQVVSGFKYRLRVAAGDSRTFDAVIVVRPWLICGSRDLVSFTPLDEYSYP